MKQSIILAATLLLAGTAFAQQGEQGGRPEGSGSGQQGSGAALFDRFDTDKDGRISQQEAQINQTLVTNFSTADANSDGYLTRQEFGATFGQ